MANTLNLSISLQATIAGQAFPLTASVTTAPAGNSAVKETQTIATTATQVLLDSITQQGYVVILNLDTTNWVQVSFESTAAVTPNVIQPGGFIVLSPSSGDVIYAKANAAPVQILLFAASI